MILLADKNVCPMVVNRYGYVKVIMEQHLSNRENYEIITNTKEEAE